MHMTAIWKHNQFFTAEASDFFGVSSWMLITCYKYSSLIFHSVATVKCNYWSRHCLCLPRQYLHSTILWFVYHCYCVSVVINCLCSFSVSVHLCISPLPHPHICEVTKQITGILHFRKVSVNSYFNILSPACLYKIITPFTHSRQEACKQSKLYTSSSKKKKLNKKQSCSFLISLSPSPWRDSFLI